MTNVDIHLISYTQGQIHCMLPVVLGAHHHAILVLDRQAELCTPLGDLTDGDILVDHIEIQFQTISAPHYQRVFIHPIIMHSSESTRVT